MNTLAVLWKTNNITDIEEMVVPYILGSKKHGWWDHVEVIIWGASQKIVANNDAVRTHVKAMIRAGVKVHAYKKCSDDLCVSDSLGDIGVDVLYTGVMLTEFLQSDTKVLTF